MVTLPHHRLPPPFDRYASILLLEHAENADKYLLMNLALLIVIAVVQLRVFARPPPVPLKRLPQRPALSILFKPDDITASSQGEENQSVASGGSHLKRRDFGRSTSSFLKSSFEFSDVDVAEVVINTVKDTLQNFQQETPPSPPRRSQFSSTSSVDTDDDHTRSAPSAEKTSKHHSNLPDSFAPLLSSSQTEVLLHQLTADLIHGVRAEATVNMQPGYHEIPLNKDSSRPQLILAAPKEGCRISFGAAVGSDGFSSAQDLDVTIETSSRSRPMVKHAGLVFDPSLPLKNVAPTLIHFPTLFEDNTVVPRLRRIQIIRFFVDTITAISSTIEKILWIIERFLQIHLGKVRIVPLYKGKVDDNSPEWRLSLAFSGHVLLFGYIPIPFINVILPTFIIPQPHALLEFLLSKQPLASATIRRENIAEQKIVLALLDTAHSWQANVDIVATPPAVGIDLTLSGGVSLGLELMHGRDVGAGRSRHDAGEGHIPTQSASRHLDDFPEISPVARAQTSSGASLSSWTTNNESLGERRPPRSFRHTTIQHFDANNLIPWKLQFSARGSLDQEKMSFHLLNCSFQHEDMSSPIPARSLLRLRGSFAVWKARQEKTAESMNLKKGYTIRRSASFAHRAALAGVTDTPSVASILLFPDDSELFHRESRMLEYDYAFDVSEDSKIDAFTFSVGANHPFLNGGTMVTTILESIYAFGSLTARQGAILDPIERHRKRNILRHLPAIDFTFGIQDSYIPVDSMSFTDDGLTKTLPAMEGGRFMVRILGGIQTEEETEEENFNSGVSMGMSVDGTEVEGAEIPVKEGIKVVAEFGFSSITLNSETRVGEFPELDVFEGTKLRALTSGKLGGCINCHLRPQQLLTAVSSTGPNIFNPLEAYEIDFSGSSLSVRIKESMTSLGHRRIIIPTETTVKVKVVESIVDMALEGKSDCELSWDFQGLSPILQVTEVGLSPEVVVHEKKQQVALLIAPLRQGRLNFHVSPVGGINITKAKTSREDREGLYDWKFFNAIVSPDQTSASRLIDVIHDKRSMGKLLQVIKLINADCHKVLNYVLTQVWRAKEILDQEGVSDPKHIIPGHRMARLFSLLLCDDVSQVPVVLPLIRRVTAGNGLDVVTVKELLREHCEFYDDWTPEIDRAVRWLETMFAPVTVPPPYVENNVTPLAQQECYASRFKNIPSATELYEQIRYRPHLPLDSHFSNVASRVAPYLSFKQIEYFLRMRSSKDWQPSDLKRLRYVYSVKRKVMDIAESYGGLSFLPQSFLVSVFLGEATRDSLRIAQSNNHDARSSRRFGGPNGLRVSNKPSTLLSLRQRRASLQDPPLVMLPEESNGGISLTPAGRVASLSNFTTLEASRTSSKTLERSSQEDQGSYELGDCLLGPADVAILLQAGLTSAMKGSSVVQLNQRMLLDLVASQPKSFAIAVLAELGTPGGQGSPRQLASALMALLELDQTSFRPVHRLNMHKLLESWLPGLKVPRREDHMAGGRWARQSYYEALFSVAKSILEDAEVYMALKLHLQRVRHHCESDPIPQPREDPRHEQQDECEDDEKSGMIHEATAHARSMIEKADRLGKDIIGDLIENEKTLKNKASYKAAVDAYTEAFDACARTREIDKLAFHSEWFGKFYQRNYDALMIKSIYDNLVHDVDKVRYWMHRLRWGAKYGAPSRNDHTLSGNYTVDGSAATTASDLGCKQEEGITENRVPSKLSPTGSDDIFLKPTEYCEQEVVDAILDAIIYNKDDREYLRNDPLVRLLIPNPPGKYDFTVVTAMGVITDGKAGTELQAAFERLEKERGVKTIRADTATARSFEYNASKIIEAIESARELGVPYGLLGYSQGCANALMAETTMYSGTPRQQQEISDRNGLVCRQLLFSAANASLHGPASDKKVQNLIVMVEDFFKYQQGYFSKALQSVFLDILTGALDSAQFHKLMGGADSFLADGCRAFWREAQHLAHVPTCTLRGVLEEHTTPEALEMLTNMLTKQSGSALHDSQVHVYDAVGHPVYHHNRNGNILKKCDVGRAAIQRTHHWSPLDEEVEFIATQRDSEMASFDCAKDRHVFPWVEVNARFGFIKYSKREDSEKRGKIDR